MCHSLAEAHARGMVHRDIKPANIFLCRMGLEFDFVKVLDFGLVQTRRADPSTAVTETLITAQQLIGTPAYMAPEMILGRDDVDRRADVYAIGCVAFYLLTGTRVFQDGNQMQVLVDHVHAEPVPPSSRSARRCRKKSTHSSSIACARTPTTGRKMPPNCWHAIAAYKLAGQMVARARPGLVAGAPAGPGGAARRRQPDPAYFLFLNMRLVCGRRKEGGSRSRPTCAPVSKAEDQW